MTEQQKFQEFMARMTAQAMQIANIAGSSVGRIWNSRDDVGYCSALSQLTSVFNDLNDAQYYCELMCHCITRRSEALRCEWQSGFESHADYQLYMLHMDELVAMTEVASRIKDQIQGQKGYCLFFVEKLVEARDASIDERKCDLKAASTKIRRLK